jgi:hypothetical protein
VANVAASAVPSGLPEIRFSVRLKL